MNKRHDLKIISPLSGSSYPRVWCEVRGDLGYLLGFAKAAGYRVDGLAGHLNICARSLRREFLRALGISAKDWLVQSRIAECQRRLRGNESISEIAYSVGFSHPKELSREFLRIYQMTPSEFACAKFSGTGNGERG
ncbi:MAG: helix-turn-helix transcriptional regulator [Akkermansiaceae bacterium]